tara:strand:- start:537 stop:1028 length:492 start_codon:yes stop_codon:yes gene_type:complete
MANKSKTYLLPYVHDYIPIEYINRLEDTYLFYEKEYKFCLLYKFSGQRNFMEYETRLMTNEYFCKTVDIHPDLVLYVFNIPDDLYRIIDLFLDGKYSYLPGKDKVKQFLLDNFNIPENHRIFHILDRSQILREELENKLNVTIAEDLDLADPPKIETEEFKKT